MVFEHKQQRQDVDCWVAGAATSRAICLPNIDSKLVIGENPV